MTVMLRLVGLLVATASWCLVSSGPLSGPKVYVNSIQQCEDYPNLPLTFTNMAVSQVAPAKFVINGQMEFKSKIASPWKMSVQLVKCSSQTNPDSCEKFYKLDSSDICKHLMKDGEIYSNFVKYTNMSRTCPIKPNVHKLTQIPVEFDVSKYPIAKGFYKVYASTMSKSGAKTGCIFMEIQISAPIKG